MQNIIQKGIQANQQNIPNWIDEEINSIQKPMTEERLPSLKLETNKITKFEIDFRKPFEKWNGEQNGKPVQKAIIPVVHKGERKNFWCNVKNPIYREICERGKKGQVEFVVSTTGSQKDTRYTIVEEE